MSDGGWTCLDCRDGGAGDRIFVVVNQRLSADSQFWADGLHHHGPRAPRQPHRHARPPLHPPAADGRKLMDWDLDQERTLPMSVSIDTAVAIRSATDRIRFGVAR